MRRFWLGLAAMTIVAACGGGNPWVDDGGGGGTTPGTGVPEALLGDLESFTYDPVAQTLIVSGISLDDTPFEATYTRRPGLDVPGYEAYTAQDGSLDRHSTAFVRERDGTRAAIVVTGGQFDVYFGGSSYSRTGAFTPPTATTPGGQLVTYAGSYVGLMNIAGDGGDLLPVTPGTPPDVLPVQAAEVTGNVLINADFADNQVNGVVYNRSIADGPSGGTSVQNIELAPAAILADGTFAGDAEQGLVGVGAYGGVFGGTNASAVAGTLFVGDHVTGFTGIEERGLFVLAQCGTPSADPICTQPNP
jgi:hypothetical protein